MAVTAEVAAMTYLAAMRMRLSPETAQAYRGTKKRPGGPGFARSRSMRSSATWV